MRQFIRPMPAVWAVTLLAGGLASNMLLMCGSNLVAFAVIAAVTLRFRVAALIAVGIWLESQVLGFTVFGYPHDTMTVAWGAALGIGTLIATGIAALCAGRTGPVAFVAAFATYELALAAFALVTGSGLGAFTPAIIFGLFSSNALIALGAVVLCCVTGSIASLIVRGVTARRPA